LGRLTYPGGVGLALYDTRDRRLRPFVPLLTGRAGIYLCGPTVQAGPHVGHLRSAVAFDILRRWLLASGFAVSFVRNVTDIDDKILTTAAAEGLPWFAVAEANTRAFSSAYDALRVLPPTVEPRATGHVPEMVALIRRLVSAGHAYAAAGDVYFEVRSLPAYGALSGQSPAAMQPSEPAAGAAKRDPLDFALWKGAKPGEPAWETPWGPGRPGWHLECSAMATRYLGSEFDIHAGGLDLIFPHHENEVAQSVGAGDAFARYWLHNGMVNTAGEKMSKSVGNSLAVADVLEAVRPQALRYYLGAPHYRSSLDYSLDGLAEAAAAYGRIETFVRNALDALGGIGEAEASALESDTPAAKAAAKAFAAALDDDLAVPRALGAVHGAVRAGNVALTGDRPGLAGWLAAVRRMLEVLALDPVQWLAAGGADGRLRGVVDALVQVALRARSDARERRDYAAADGIRDALSAAGVVVEDGPDSSRWHLR